MMQVMKCVGNGSQSRLIHAVSPLNRDVELPGLALITQVGEPGNLDSSFRHLLFRQLSDPFRFHFLENSLKLSRVKVVFLAGKGPDIVVLNVRNRQPYGREVAAHGRGDDPGHTQFTGQGCRVKRGSPSHGHKCKLPQVISFLHRVSADALGHVGIDDPDDAEGGSSRASPILSATCA